MDWDRPRELNVHLDVAVEILWSRRCYRERVTYGFHEQRPYMQKNESHVLFVRRSVHVCAFDSLFWLGLESGCRRDR